jgi:flagellar assembly factor FliW
MLIQTARFGTVEIDDSKVITFDDGLFGFPDCKRFAILQACPDGALFWLQSVDQPTVAFVVCEPRLFVSEYEPAIRRDDAEALGLEMVEDARVLAIVNRVNGELTANLLGPLVINAQNLRGRQLVLSDRRFGTRHVILTGSIGERRVAKSA